MVSNLLLVSLFQREEFPGIQSVHFYRPLWAEIPVLFSGIPAPAEVSIPWGQVNQEKHSRNFQLEVHRGF